ncbi:MAG: lipopolysaccharide heptosyltransferase II [Candidatus Acidiferrales bacterium]
MKILVRATNWVGDAIMSIPALEAIRARWSDADLTTLALPGIADLLRGQPSVGRLLVFDRAGRHAGVLGRERLAAELRRERFDVAVLFQNAFDAAWIAWRAGIRERIGYARDGRGLFLTRAVRVAAKGEIPAHESFYYLELLRRAGWVSRLPDRVEIALRVEFAAREAAEAKLIQAGARKGVLRCALAPGASFGSARCWPPDRFGKLAALLRAQYGGEVILLGAPTEGTLARAIAEASGNSVINLVGQTNMTEIPALLAACDLFIGNDSGLTHVAGAVGLPIVGIYGSTDPDETRPVAARLEVVRHAVSCSPCFLRKCPVDHRCMTRIGVAQVLAAAQKWIERPGQRAGVPS